MATPKTNSSLERLSKLMAQRGMCSRREADNFIANGYVSVDNKIINTLGTKIHPDQHIELHPDAKQEQQRLVTILINKPIGYVSGQAEKGYHAATRLLTRKYYRGPSNHYPNLSPKLSKNFAPAGRLDIDSQGLLVLTQDGRIAKLIIGAHSRVEKEYLVRITGSVTAAKIESLRHGLSLDGRQLKPAKIVLRKGNLLNFTLTEGRKRQIRRMCQLVDLEVTGLTRIRIGKVRLGRLAEGCWRTLNLEEGF